LTAETAVIAHEAQLLGKMMILTVAAVTVPWTEIGAVALFPSMEMIVSFARKLLLPIMRMTWIQRISPIR